jgi:hypothetical protein
VLYFSKPESGRISKENDIGIATRYQKNSGWNKGLQKDYLTAEVINKLKKSQFKKGHNPIIQ